MLKEENQIYMLCSLFLTVVMIPIGLLTKYGDHNDDSASFGVTGVHKESVTAMETVLFDVLIRNMKKNVKVISDN